MWLREFRKQKQPSGWTRQANPRVRLLVCFHQTVQYDMITWCLRTERPLHRAALSADSWPSGEATGGYSTQRSLSRQSFTAGYFISAPQEILKVGFSYNHNKWDFFLLSPPPPSHYTWIPPGGIINVQLWWVIFTAALLLRSKREKKKIQQP